MAHERGFTLLEVLVALAIAALVVLVAYQLFNGIVEGTRLIVAARVSLDREVNARRWLTATFLSLDVGTDSAVAFDGRPDRATFSAWLLTEDGWFARRTVTLSQQEDQLVATLAPDETIVLHERVQAVGFDYLLQPGTDVQWVQHWVSPLRAPLAVRLRVEGRRAAATDMKPARVDTLLFLVKERG